MLQPNFYQKKNKLQFDLLSIKLYTAFVQIISDLFIQYEPLKSSGPLAVQWIKTKVGEGAFGFYGPSSTQLTQTKNIPSLL